MLLQIALGDDLYAEIK